jgi:hypothetical protein
VVEAQVVVSVVKVQASAAFVQDVHGPLLPLGERPRSTPFREDQGGSGI